MNANDSNELQLPDAPTLRFSIAFYRAALRLTRRHGLFTIARAHVRLFPQGQFVRLPTGARLFVPADSHFFGFVLGIHEQHITDMLRRFIRPGDLCIDVGANIGYFTAIMAQLAGRSGRIIAFEPVPENFSVLKLNAEIASARSAQVIPVEAAASEHHGTVRIIRREYSTYHQVGPSDETGSVDTARCVRLDDELPYLAPGRHISFLKIDVEGHELSVLRGLQQSLGAKRVQRLVVEVTPGPDAVEINEILSNCARHVECWVDGAWRNQSIMSLTERTDVFADCTTR